MTFVSGVSRKARDFYYKLKWWGRGAPVEIDQFAFRIDESLRRWKLDTEHEVRQAFRDHIKPGFIVFDIGANFGLHTIFISALAGKSGKVYAFEPIPSNIRLLKRNIHLNALGNSVVVVEAAVSDSRNETIDMTVPGIEVAVSASIATGNDKGYRHIAVNSVRLDDYAMQRNIAPQFIKIDVEGAEFGVLKSAEGILRKFKPVLLIEIHTFALHSFGVVESDIIKYLKGLGYTSKEQFITEGEAGGYYHAVFTSV
jgi:FkbM family methyltransferase